MENDAENTRYHPRKQRPASPSPQHPKQRQVGGLGRGFSMEEGGCAGSEMWVGKRCFRPVRSVGAAGGDRALCVGEFPTGSPSPQIWAASRVG